ncbi:esterase-like activity of phytase family protein [Aquipseudomonas campi]|uniref:Esterase-like activity of phytase family protein n=1 Tax=Aquipseudomonas campi TaxID=2731681 RepID=A0A6M8FE99_9GAMM|nr:esterase-like activity of phytase family protein [Pseudomonas campi]QKE65631.1 esterase-like activity of phytase family protein [Pseudomonas campi]
MAAAAEQPVQPVELELLAEYPVDGMAGGNLSGLTRCGAEWLAVSDREDERLYRLVPGDAAWQAEAETFAASPVPRSALPWGLRMRTWAANLVRGGELDFESISCDAKGNRYLLSEAHTALLQVGPSGMAEWLALPDELLRQARASGMLLRHNALLEGLVVDQAGERLWLAAERERRGLLVLHKDKGRWRCTGGCILMSEAGQLRSPLTPQSDQRHPRSFGDLAFHDGRLFTLERLEQRICRRDLTTGAEQKCWSFSAAALADGRSYPEPYGNAEALWLDKDGAWLGLDNNDQARADGESRPLLWHFKAPAGGWSAP